MMDTRLSRSQRGWEDGGCIQKSLSCCYQDFRVRFFKYHFSIFIPNKYCSHSLERGVTVMMMIMKGLPWLSTLHSSTLSSCPRPAPAPSAPRPASARSLVPSSTCMALCMCCQTGLPFSGQRPSNPDVSAKCTGAQQLHSKDRPAGMT